MLASVWLKTDNPTGVITLLGFNDPQQNYITLTKDWNRYYYYSYFNSNAQAPESPRGIQVPFAIPTGTMPTGNVYIYGAQLEVNSTVPGPYIENGATATIYNTTSSRWVSRYATLYPSQNLLTNSNNFLDAWANNAGGTPYLPPATIHGTNYPDPLGGNSATQFLSNGGFGGFFTSVTLTVGVTCTFSIYIKYISGADGKFYFGTNGLGSIYDLSNGSFISNTYAGYSSSITSVGNGWYRLTQTGPFPGGDYYNFMVLFSVSGGSTFQIYGAQLEANTAIASTYIETTGTVSTPAYNSQSDPFGGKRAVKLIETPDNQNHSIQQLYITTNSNSPYVFSAYFKAAENSYVSISVNDVAGNSIYVLFDVYSGIAYNAAPAAPYNDVLINQASGSIYPVGNGWYRCAVSSFITNNRYGLGIGINFANSNNSSIPQAYLGTGGGFYMYGAQLETGILPGHYIDNTGTQLNYVYSLPWDPAQNNIFYNGQKLLTGTNAQMRGSVSSIGPTSFAYTTGKNLLLYSQEFNASNYWGLSANLGITNNYTDPLGGSNGSLLKYTGASPAQSYVSWQLPVNPSTVYTLSFYLTTGNLINGILGYSFGGYDIINGSYPNNYIGDISRQILISSLQTGVNGGGVFQNTSCEIAGPNVYPYTGVNTHTSTYINNGWYRHQWTFNTSQYTKSIQFSLWLASYGGTNVSGGSMGIFGAQLEYGSGATSYSRTSNTINTTRTNGVYFLSGSQPFSSSSGNLFALPRNFQTEITGKYNVYNLPKFYNGFSEVYKNGRRLINSMDYIEIGKTSFNTGSGIFDTKPYLLYNNNNI